MQCRYRSTVPVTTYQAQQKQVTENVTQQYAVQVPYTVPVTTCRAQHKQVTENVTQQYAVQVPYTVPVTTFLPGAAEAGDREHDPAVRGSGTVHGTRDDLSGEAKAQVTESVVPGSTRFRYRTRYP